MDLGSRRTDPLSMQVVELQTCRSLQLMASSTGLGRGSRAGSGAVFLKRHNFFYGAGHWECDHSSMTIWEMQIVLGVFLPDWGVDSRG